MCWLVIADGPRDEDVPGDPHGYEYNDFPSSWFQMKTTALLSEIQKGLYYS